MLKILQARLQQYVNYELPDIQADFRKGRAKDQIAHICWIMEKAREFQKNIYFAQSLGPVPWSSPCPVPWTSRRSNQSILKEISLSIYWKD